MVNTLSLVGCSYPIMVDERNKRLVINGYAQGTKPYLLGRQLINMAINKRLEKIWLWALPADVPEFLLCGFLIEGSLFRGNAEEFSISLAYFLDQTRGHSDHLSAENDLIQAVKEKPINSSPRLPLQIMLMLLDESFAQPISQLLTRIFTSYPSPIENPQYIRTLIQSGNIFAGAFSRQKLIGVAAAYLDPLLNRCEMTDCATIEKYRGYSLSEHLLSNLEHEVQKRGSFNVYTLARARSYGMNRVFYKLGYRYQGCLINNCHIAGSYEDMNLWIK